MKSTISAIAFVAMFFIAVVYLISFFSYLFPIFYPIFLEGRLWASWLVMGAFIAPLMLLIAFVSIKATGSQELKWKSTIYGTVMAFLSLSGLAFIFANFLPSDFEPFRSGFLPVIILALVFVVFSRTKYMKKIQDY